MKDLKYKIKCFRLNEETYKQLHELRKKERLSWNLLFLKMIKKYANETMSELPRE